MFALLYATVTTIPVGAVNVERPVLKKNCIVWPAAAVVGTLTVSWPSCEYPLPVFQSTVTVYVVVAAGTEFSVSVME